MRNLLLLALAAAALVGCNAGTVSEDSVKADEAATAERIKAAGGEATSENQGE